MYAFGMYFLMVFRIVADDPSINVIDAFKKSMILMKGNLWRFCCLFFRFFWWFLLCIPTLGIGFLWVIPYLATTNSIFYDIIKEEALQRSAKNGHHELSSAAENLT
jgi:uncharacterized membrane protein